MRHATRFLAALAATALVVGPATSAVATQVTPAVNGITCQVTATQPTVSSMQQLAGRATILCSKASGVTANTVTVNYSITVVEMDGTVEQALSSYFQKALSITVTIGMPTAISSYKLWCPNTEAGNEEYASKAAVMIIGSGTWSAIDRSKPSLDQYAC